MFGFDKNHCSASSEYANEANYVKEIHFDVILENEDGTTMKIGTGYGMAVQLTDIINDRVSIYIVMDAHSRELSSVFDAVFLDVLPA